MTQETVLNANKVFSSTSKLTNVSSYLLTVQLQTFMETALSVKRDFLSTWWENADLCQKTVIALSRIIFVLYAWLGSMLIQLGSVKLWPTIVLRLLLKETVLNATMVSSLILEMNAVLFQLIATRLMLMVIVPFACLDSSFSLMGDAINYRQIASKWISMVIVLPVLQVFTLMRLTIA